MPTQNAERTARRFSPARRYAWWARSWALRYSSSRPSMNAQVASSSRSSASSGAAPSARESAAYASVHALFSTASRPCRSSSIAASSARPVATSSELSRATAVRAPHGLSGRYLGPAVVSTAAVVPRENRAPTTPNSSTRAIASASGPERVHLPGAGRCTRRGACSQRQNRPAVSTRSRRSCRSRRHGWDLRREPRHVAAAARPGGGRDDRLGRRREGDRGSGVEAACVGDGVPADPAVHRRDRGETALAGRHRHGSRRRRDRQPRRRDPHRPPRRRRCATSVRVSFVDGTRSTASDRLDRSGERHRRPPAASAGRR